MSNLQKTLTAGLMHGLKCLVKDGMEEKTLTLSGIYQDGACCFFDAVESEKGYKSVKPYLFPMSALTKEIEFGGKRFVPYIELLRICNFDVDNMSDEELNHYKDNCRDIELMMFFEVEKLIEWHFNVFGLSSDEFIEVNETNNPYK